MRILLAAKHAPHGKRPIGGVNATWDEYHVTDVEIGLIT